jgi:uncharacterized protein
VDLLAQFAGKQYLSLETFRKSGVGVKTPVWFVQDGELMYVITRMDSGKVKRIRNNGRVNVAPCTAGGRPLGTWIAAQAQVLTESTDYERADRLLGNKYGLLKRLFFRDSAQGKAKNIVLGIRITG